MATESTWSKYLTKLINTKLHNQIEATQAVEKVRGPQLKIFSAVEKYVTVVIEKEGPTVKRECTTIQNERSAFTTPSKCVINVKTRSGLRKSLAERKWSSQFQSCLHQFSLLKSTLVNVSQDYDEVVWQTEAMFFFFTEPPVAQRQKCFDQITRQPPFQAHPHCVFKVRRT